MSDERKEQDAPLEDDEETRDLERDERTEERQQRRATNWWQRRRVEPEERDRVLGELFQEGDRRVPYLYRLAFLQSMSVVVAVVGMMADSPALVIGAMLLAPLMSPVLAVAAALVMVWPKRLAFSAGLVALASLGSAGLAWAIAVLLPDLIAGPLPHELTSRTSPNLLDLVVALAAGAAGGYSMVREEVGRALPGVAVAVALVPPLAAVGLALSLGEAGLAVGAGLLYVTNLAAIVLAAGVVFLATGFIPTVRVSRLSWQVGLALAAALVPVALVAVPLTRTLQDSLAEASTLREVGRVVPAWLAGEPFDLVEVRVEPDQVVVVLAGDGTPPPASELAALLPDPPPEAIRVDVIQRTTDVFYP